MGSKSDFKILAEKRYFRLQQILEIYETTIPKFPSLHDRLDFREF
jgi:hypothetical protein